MPPGAWFVLDPFAPSPDGGGGGPCARLIWAIAINASNNNGSINDLNVFFIVWFLLIVCYIGFVVSIFPGGFRI